MWQPVSTSMLARNIAAAVRRIRVESRIMRVSPCIRSGVEGGKFTARGCRARLRREGRSGAWQRDAALALVLAATVGVGHSALLVGLEQEHLRHAFVSVDFCGQRGGVGELQGHVTLPLRLERGHVHDDAAAGIRALAEADREHLARNAEVLNGACQGERIRRDDADVRLDVDEAALVERLRIDDRGVDVREHLELVGAADVVAVAGRAIRHQPVAVALLDLARGERLDHAVFGGHAANPLVGLDAHLLSPSLEPERYRNAVEHATYVFWMTILGKEIALFRACSESFAAVLRAMAR